MFTESMWIAPKPYYNPIFCSNELKMKICLLTFE